MPAFGIRVQCAQRGVKAGQAFLPLLPLHKVLLRGLPVETPIARRRLESEAEAWTIGGDVCRIHNHVWDSNEKSAGRRLCWACSACLEPAPMLWVTRPVPGSIPRVKSHSLRFGSLLGLAKEPQGLVRDVDEASELPRLVRSSQQGPQLEIFQNPCGDSRPPRPQRGTAMVEVPRALMLHDASSGSPCPESLKEELC